MAFQTHSLTQQLAEHLSDRIIRGEYAPGEPLRESVIAKELGVSRGAVREALLLLERQYLVKWQPRKGASVEPLDGEGAAQVIEALFSLLVVLMRQWPQLNAEEHALVENLLTRILNAQEKGRTTFFETSVDILQDVAGLTLNPYLVSAMQDLIPAAKRAYWLVLRERPSVVTQMAEAIAGLLDVLDRPATQERERALWAMGQTLVEGMRQQKIPG
jgi:DNA-binding GntR family transcriptional regulator